ncbi:MAG: hypothetical protein CSA81_09915 [Acidobacteria bacterium]|nr:MAG: hypothetical protein CSA81_09915 [Acidobacteriota bacterium]
MSQEEYITLFSILRDAKEISKTKHTFYDLEDSENVITTKKKFQFIAQKESIDVIVRRVRGTNSLSFTFPKSSRKSYSRRTRISSEECKKRILTVLEGAQSPMRKNEIIRAAGISGSTWNTRIKELLDEGCVSREGQRRETRYTFVKWL